MIIKVLYAQHSELFPNSMSDLFLGRPSNVPYREVANIAPDEIEVENETDNHQILGRVWRAMNCVEGDPEVEICVRLRVRSMMVGDRVVLEREGLTMTYQCAGVGWKILEAAS